MSLPSLVPYKSYIRIYVTEKGDNKVDAPVGSNRVKFDEVVEGSWWYIWSLGVFLKRFE